MSMKKKSMLFFTSTVIGAVVGSWFTLEKEVSKRVDIKELSDKHLALFLMMNQWVKIKQRGKCLSDYFEANQYRKIAIYGISFAGETLIDELKGTGIQVAYGIDKSANLIHADVDVFTMEDNLGEVDAVVVTAVTFFNEIEEKLADKFNCPILSLEDILYEI